MQDPWRFIHAVGGHTRFHPFKRGPQILLTYLEGGGRAAKVEDLQFSNFVAPSLPISNDRSLSWRRRPLTHFLTLSPMDAAMSMPSWTCRHTSWICWSFSLKLFFSSWKIHTSSDRSQRYKHSLVYFRKFPLQLKVYFHVVKKHVTFRPQH